jgi:dTDP-4-dehydrorhamnose reductase
LKKKVLVLGATGMLGHMVYRVLREAGAIQVYGTHLDDKNDLYYFDVESGLEGLVRICDRSSGYDYFINCIGMLAGKIKLEDPVSIRKAIKLNTLFPHELSFLAKELKTKVIHISTDGVFSGKAEYYNEDAIHDCTDLYGITKSLGEVVDDHFLNLRCSIIGPSPFEKGGLLEWFLQQPDETVVPGYTNHIWHGVSTYQFGKLCLKIIEEDYFGKLREESSVFHFAPNEPITKYELLCLFRDNFGKNVKIEAVQTDERTYKRILATKYHKLRAFYPHGLSAAEMVSELVHYLNSNRKE